VASSARSPSQISSTSSALNTWMQDSKHANPMLLRGVKWQKRFGTRRAHFGCRILRSSCPAPPQWRNKGRTHTSADRRQRKTMSATTSRFARYMVAPCHTTTNRGFSWSFKRPISSLSALTNRPCSLATRISSLQHCVGFSTSSDATSGPQSPFASSTTSSSLQKKRPRKKLKFVPRKAAVALTPKARNFFRALLENTSDEQVVGIMLNYHQSSTGEPRMVFSFDFCKAHQLTLQDEG